MDAGAGASGGAGGASGGSGAGGRPQIDAGGSAGESCKMIRFDGGVSSHGLDAGCDCPSIFTARPHGAACSELTDCAECKEGTCGAECVRCEPDAAPRWWVTCTE
jgi:hypothetical protein